MSRSYLLPSDAVYNYAVLHGYNLNPVTFGNGFLDCFKLFIVYLPTHVITYGRQLSIASFAISSYSSMLSMIPGFKKGCAAILYVPYSWSIMLPQRLFILCFLHFIIVQVRRTSPSTKDAGHSWRDYRFHIAHPLRSTVAVVYCLPRYFPGENKSFISLNPFL